MKPLFLLTAALLLTNCTNLRNPLAKPSASTHPDILRQQIFLDSENFGPGVVDGRLGEFTRKAMANYRQAKSLPADWMPDTGGISGHYL